MCYVIAPRGLELLAGRDGRLTTPPTVRSSARDPSPKSSSPPGHPRAPVVVARRGRRPPAAPGPPRRARHRVDARARARPRRVGAEVAGTRGVGALSAAALGSRRACGDRPRRPAPARRAHPPRLPAHRLRRRPRGGGALRDRAPRRERRVAAGAGRAWRRAGRGSRPALSRAVEPLECACWSSSTTASPRLTPTPPPWPSWSATTTCSPAGRCARPASLVDPALRAVCPDRSRRSRPVVVFLCRDRPRARECARRADHVLSACRAYAGEHPRDWEYPGRAAVVFASERDVHEGQLLAYGVPRLPPAVRTGAPQAANPAPARPRVEARELLLGQRPR